MNRKRAPRLTAEERYRRNQEIWLLRQGYTQQEIATHLDITQARVQQIMREVDAPKSEWKKEHHKHIISEFLSGVPMKKIDTPLSYATVRQLLQHSKLLSQRINQPFLPADHFWRYVRSADENGCRLWTAQMFPSGYGRVIHRRAPDRLAHRVAWILIHGQIPLLSNGKTMSVLHCRHCPNRACCEDSHLYVGTPAENVADRVAARGR